MTGLRIMADNKPAPLTARYWPLVAFFGSAAFAASLESVVAEKNAALKRSL